MRKLHIVWIGAVVGLGPLYGCAAAPRVRPVEMGPVATGPASLEAVRRQLLGTWELVTLDLVSAAGQRTRAQAGGRLSYDEFGNMAMKGAITGNEAIDPSVLNLTGRVAIDPVKRTLKFEAITAASADERRLDPQIDATRTRYYEIVGDVLTTTVKAADGSTTAIATWKRLPPQS